VLENVVFTDWLSPDERYVIFLDDLIDLKEEKSLGNVWEKPDNLILFLEHTFRVSSLKKSIKEEARNVFENLLLVESDVNLSSIKPLIKTYLQENLWNNFTSWVSDTAKSTVKGVSDFVVDSWEGVKKLGLAISKGDWDEILMLAKKGSKWLARKIRQAVYSPVGIIIDTILVATGYGKVPQIVVWAIVVALDIYEFTTGDYEHPEEPMWMRIIFFLVDVIGLVFAGVAAKAARIGVKGAIEGARATGNVGASLAKNKGFMEVLKTGIEALKSLPSKLASMSKYFKEGTFFSKLFSKAISGVAAFSKMIINGIKNIFKGPALKPVLINLGILSAIGTYGEYQKEKNIASSKSDEKELIAALEKDKKDDDWSKYIK
jgi:hypothetical protein